MTRRESRTADLALDILQKAAKMRGPTARSDAVQLALRVLLPYVGRHSLMDFWRICENPQPMQRVHHLTRIVAGIEAVVARAAGVRD